MRRWILDRFRTGVVSAIFITSFYVKLEPAVTDFLGLLALVLFFRSGLHLSRYLAAPMAFLLIYLISNIVSSIPIERPQYLATNPNYLLYPLILAYTSVTGFFIAAYIAADPAKRYVQIERAYWIGGTLGAILGFAVYFGFSPALYLVSHFGSGYDDYFGSRVLGGFKDPNVFSTWLLFPIASMMQALMTGRLRRGLLSFGSLFIMLLALIFAFSRGAWADLVLTTVIMMSLNLMLTPSPVQRQKFIVASLVIIAVAALLLVALLADPTMRELFQSRFQLIQRYDGGETGRFGNQLNAIPNLLTMPLGFGPYQFNLIYLIAPHNTFLNAFAAGGWSSGIAYILLCITNLYYGSKAAFTRSPLQPFAIIVFSCLVSITFQGVQIDQEHWRHYFVLMGLSWGLLAATMEHRAGGSALESWNALPRSTRASMKSAHRPIHAQR